MFFGEKKKKGWEKRPIHFRSCPLWLPVYFRAALRDLFPSVQHQFILNIMRIVTWNINGIRTFKGRIKNALDSLDADIICIQETKVTSKYKRALPRLGAVLSHNVDISLLLLNSNFCCFPPSEQETCLRQELPLLTATTPISASVEDVADIQVW